MTSLQEIVQHRRTIRKFTQEDISTAELISLMEVAVYAPNHKEREPWSFTLIRDGAKDTLYQEIVKSYERLDILSGLEKEVVEKKQEQLKKLILDPAMHLIVTMEQSEQEKVWEEDFAATSAFIQNLQLLAWEQGIGMVWKTNPYIKDPEFLRAMNINESKKIVGILHIGRPYKIPKAKPRTSVSEKLDIFE
ncbi:nitroreductase [Pontibacillus salicampi]|uniref:Putative NAD(P)H nitroreductase n=1 Tax=Pontibacillus salicampi TaxID=1449801 RepID=A0ABV6LPN5_9BACI